MQENENQYGGIDRRKVVLLVVGIFVILAAIVIVIYLFTDKTKASTGTGGTAMISPDRIEQISDDVSKQVLDTLCADILTDMIKDSVAEELTEDKIYEVISDGNVEAIQIGGDELRAYIAKMLYELEISGDGVLSDEQKNYIKLIIEQALQESLGSISVTQLLTDEEKKQLEEQLKKELSDLFREQIVDSTYQLTDKELEKIKKALNLESLIKNEASTITKQQLEKLQANIINNVKKSVKAPVKGVDYFTEAEIKALQEAVLKKVNQETQKQVESLISKINAVKASVNELEKQVKELKTLDKNKASDISKLQKSITKINTSIQNINSVTKELTNAITISGSNLEKVSGKGSEIQSVSVSAANMTIAEFVDVLAGNDRVYTGAIQELNGIVKQLKDENAKQDEAFDKSLKELENSLGENGKEMEDVKTKLEKSDQELKKQLEQQGSALKKELEAEQKARQEADKDLQSKTDAANALIGDKADAGKIEGSTVFEKIGAIVKILSNEGLDGLRRALLETGGAETMEEGIDNINSDLAQTKARVGELEKEKWYSDITLLAEGQEGAAGYACRESGSAYVYQIPLVTEDDQINLSDDDTAVVVDFKRPDRLPSHVAFSTSGSDLLVTFTNKPTRNIEIVSIHVYKEK